MTSVSPGSISTSPSARHCIDHSLGKSIMQVGADPSGHAILSDGLDQPRRNEGKREQHRDGSDAPSLFSRQSFDVDLAARRKFVRPRPCFADRSQKPPSRIKTHRSGIISLPEVIFRYRSLTESFAIFA